MTDTGDFTRMDIGKAVAAGTDYVSTVEASLRLPYDMETFDYSSTVGLLLEFGLIDESDALASSTDFLYQYASILQDDSDERVTIGCAMTLEESSTGYVDSYVFNYYGENSMQSDSDAVVGSSFTAQNYDDMVTDVFSWEPEFDETYRRRRLHKAKNEHYHKAQEVKNKLIAMGKKGRPYPLKHYESLASHREKREFTLKLTVDKNAAWLEILETKWKSEEAEI